ncbi:Acidic leucine-rich nuclear phosphoprotein 32-related protein 1 [Hordeum vulgare]|nr:Acidic leucine-rich nuclear phosphoprotein 32-related protein 1 [Hordeum vulgare]
METVSPSTKDYEGHVLPFPCFLDQKDLASDQRWRGRGRWRRRCTPPARSPTLDGTVKCMHRRFPAVEILERHQSLEHLSIAGVGVASLAGFPRLRNLARLTLSDNRIAGGLKHLVEAGLASLRDLDLSNNRIQNVDDLAPLARLRLVSLDLSTR